MGSSSWSKRKNFDRGLSVVLAMVLLVMGEKGVVVGQQTATCAAKLVPCSNYLNSTNPPESCCNPLREAVRDDLKCLCDLYSDRQFLTTLGVNVTQALELPKHCGLGSNLTACNNQTAPTSPPSSPSGSSGGNSHAAGAAWIGMFCWMGMLLSWASVVG